VPANPDVSEVPGPQDRSKKFQARENHGDLYGSNRELSASQTSFSPRKSSADGGPTAVPRTTFLKWEDEGLELEAEQQRYLALRGDAGAVFSFTD